MHNIKDKESEFQNNPNKINNQVLTSRTTPNSKNNNFIKLNQSAFPPSPNKWANGENLMNLEEDSFQLKSQLLIQTNTLREYDNWVNLMLNIINARENPENHFDFASNIQKRLEKIKSLENENWELVAKYFKEVENNKLKTLNINRMKSELENIEVIKKSQLKEEIKRLKENINCLGEELDDLSEKNNTLESKIKKNPELEKIYSSLQELERLKKENEQLKNLELIKYNKNRKEKDSNDTYDYNNSYNFGI